MKKFKLFFKITLMCLLGLFLVTCEEEDQMISEIDVISKKAPPIISNGVSDYLMDMISTIEAMVDEGVVNRGNGNALISKINNAIKSIEKGNTNAVNGQLRAFINEVEALVENGTFTEEQGQTLNNTAENGIILAEGSVNDPNDGYEYPVVLIGEQLWMAENLKATKYNDGTDIDIPLVTDPIIWAGLSTPAYCWYENDISNGHTYGALYNWHTVQTGNLCPTGWHVPSDGEWETLVIYLGGSSVAGDKLKEPGTSHWQTPNIGATNETGFTALPGGWRNLDGSFHYIVLDGSWWSATENGTGNAWVREVAYTNGGVFRYYASKKVGFSVRCIKD